MFDLLGYRPMADSSHEVGIEKVALYSKGKSKEPTHAARQDNSSGMWLSKLGTMYDIAHDNLEDLESVIYGEVFDIFQRPTDLSSPMTVDLLYAHQDHIETVLLA